MVSIITPVHNAEKYLKKAIFSVFKQTYENWELILVDDHSTDKSTEIISDFALLEPRVKALFLIDGHGPADARNFGIQEAKGRYIAFLDADDVWLPEKLEVQLQYMNSHKLLFTYSSYLKINEQGEIIGRFEAPKELTYRQLLKTNSIGCLTAIYDAKLLGKMYMPEILKRQDYGLWLDIVKILGSVSSTDPSAPLAEYRVRTDSISSNKLSLIRYNWRLLYKHQHLNIFVASFYIFCQIWRKIF